MWITFTCGDHYHIPPVPQSRIASHRVDRNVGIIFNYEMEFAQLGKHTYYRIREVDTNCQVMQRSTINNIQRRLKANIAMYEHFEKVSNDLCVAASDFDSISTMAVSATHRLAREDVTVAKFALDIIDNGVFSTTPMRFALDASGAEVMASFLMIEPIDND